MKSSALAAIGIFIVLFTSTQSHLNVYLNLQEVTRLIGVSAELYYVRDGQVNDYALNFAVPVPANVDEISFTWQSLAKHPLSYSINIITSDPYVLPRPTLNISHIGEVPVEPQTYAITMKCSGTRDAEVEITIAIEIILNHHVNNITDLVFRRKKICLADSSYKNKAASVDNPESVFHPNALDTLNINNNQIDDANGVQNEVFENALDPLLKETVTPPQNSLITLIVGAILAFLLVFSLILITFYAKGPAKRQNHDVHLIKTSSFQRLPTVSSMAQNSIYVCSPSTPPTYATLEFPFCQYKYNEEDLNRRLSALAVQKCRVRLSSLEQSGAFGRIYKGTYNECQEVLVKTVTQYSSQQQVSIFLKESVMLSGASHPNILTVLGVSIEDYFTPFILYPATNNMRNLKLFIQDPSYGRTVTTIQAVILASQLVTAMQYLHNHGVIHKDIAARNCVIDDDLSVKLTDSSLARDVFPCEYDCLADGENRPIKWLSLEALQKSDFNEGSDVWAFGVLMWELATLGKIPYAEIDPYEMEHYLKDGYRLAQPVNCPDELFTIMAYCWAVLPSERPSFSQLQICLSEFHSQITRYV